MEEVSLEWCLAALIQSLKKLSFPAEKQIALMGPHDIPLNLSVDFDCYYVHYREEFVGSGLLSSEQLEALDRLDAYFKGISWMAENLIENAFWGKREQLITHPDWEQLRMLAMRCLELF